MSGKTLSLLEVAGRIRDSTQQVHLRLSCLVGGSSEDEVPALSIGSLEQGCVLMVGLQHVLTVRVPMRWA